MMVVARGETFLNNRVGYRSVVPHNEIRYDFEIFYELKLSIVKSYFILYCEPTARYPTLQYKCIMTSINNTIYRVEYLP